MKDKYARIKGEIIKYLYYGGALSCSELSELTRKSLPFVTRMIAELSEEGYVLEMGFASSTGGRRPQTYALDSNMFGMVSVAMDQYITRVCILAPDNTLMCPEREYELTLPGNDNALQQLGQILENYLSGCVAERKKLVGVGIGMPGFIDVRKGFNHSFLPPPPGQSVTGFLSGLLGLPVFIDNDSSLIALAEAKFGDGRNKHNCMIINIGWGVGLGMILNDSLFRGNNGFAGEFSHIPLFTNNKICSCGKLGCLETETSLVVLVKMAQEGMAKGQTTSLPPLDGLPLEEAINAIMKAAHKGDRFVVELLGEIGYNIGRGIAILIHILNPAHVILSGRGAAAGKLWLPSVQKAINEHCIPRISEKTTLSVSTMGKSAELVGAASLVMENFHAYYEGADASVKRKKVLH